jgi:CheY-like chemotaxis protein
VEMMQGQITVESEEGKGSSFRFTIKLRQSDFEPNFEEEETINLDSLLAERFPLNILVAEDNKVNQLVIKKMMKKLGYEIQIAENGVKAIEMYEENRDNIDLIFMDMSMPLMDGIEATEKIREKFGNEVEIHALTANAFQEDKENCLAAGMDGFLTKPLKIDEISKVIVSNSKNKQMKKAS